MLSYLHSFHAGSRSDVHKHRALVTLLIRLINKPKPITYMETHAGRGLYDLSSPEAEKTGEAKNGIHQLIDDTNDHVGDPYLAVVKAAQEQYGPSFYPGSPWIARHLLRSGDSLHLMERHPGEYPVLKRLMQGADTHVHHRDGYEGVLAISPPPSRRGLVLIDPSYEVKDEYMRVAQFIPTLHRKWPEAVVLLWYPLLAEGRHKAMMAQLSTADLPKTETHDTIFPVSGGSQRILGSGLFIVNKPFGFTLKDAAFSF